MHRRDSNDALHPSYEGGKSFMRAGIVAKLQEIVPEFKPEG